MKLTIQKLTSLSTQDLIDLAKIWPEQTENDWQASLKGNHALFAAVFNERILGAVKLSLNGDSAELQDLLVREVTRRRGVGLYLIEDMLAQMPQIKRWQLSTAGLAPDERDKIDLFMPACGFRAQGNLWQK